MVLKMWERYLHSATIAALGLSSCLTSPSPCSCSIPKSAPIGVEEVVPAGRGAEGSVEPVTLEEVEGRVVVGEVTSRWAPSRL